MKNLIKKLREKLELDNPERYVDGYYQLTKKQKKSWVLVMFAASMIVPLFKTFSIESFYLFFVSISASVISALGIILISYIVTLLFLASFSFGRRFNDYGSAYKNIENYDITKFVLRSLICSFTITYLILA